MAVEHRRVDPARYHGNVRAHRANLPHDVEGGGPAQRGRAHADESGRLDLARVGHERATAIQDEVREHDVVPVPLEHGREEVEAVRRARAHGVHAPRTEMSVVVEVQDRWRDEDDFHAGNSVAALRAKNASTASSACGVRQRRNRSTGVRPPSGCG